MQTKGNRRSRIIWRALVIVGLTILALWVLHYIRDIETVELDQSVRAQAPGKFVKLSDGVVHYQLIGSAEAPTIILIPGATLPFFVWEPIVDRMVGAGFRVLRFDLLGRGYSDRPNLRNDPAFFNKQIKELLVALQVKSPVHLMGIASGGLTSVLYTDQYPNDVSSLILICPEGHAIKQSSTPFILRLLLMPGIGDYLTDISGEKLLLDRLNGYSDDPKIVDDLRNRFRPSIHIKGFKRSLLSFLRNMPLRDADAVYWRVGERRLPTLIIWGNRDRVTPVDLAKPVHEAMPHA
ncbi:MAG: alpha/beta hydrolase, partial [Acidobacteria bacterium]|nr:alpha/beta hydrolase [Acidobacteriota bacterium]